eukprot:scaffold1183_cov418-Prasinococcus_capsulatus_cf.AAC.4
MHTLRLSDAMDPGADPLQEVQRREFREDLSGRGLESAMKNLKSTVFWFGITEHFDASICLLLYQQGSSGYVEVAETYKKDIRPLIELDLQLYDFALALFKQRVREAEKATAPLQLRPLPPHCRLAVGELLRARRAQWGDEMLGLRAHALSQPRRATGRCRASNAYRSDPYVQRLAASASRSVASGIQPGKAMGVGRPSWDPPAHAQQKQPGGLRAQSRARTVSRYMYTGVS